MSEGRCGNPSRARFEELSRGYRRELERMSCVGARLSGARLVSFVVSGLAFVAGIWAGFVDNAVMMGTGVVFLAVFLGLVLKHRRVAARIEELNALEGLCSEGIARIDRRWGDLPEIPSPEIDDEFGIGGDLDLFGPVSLYRLTGGGQTFLGRLRLARWLLEPAPAKERERRQSFVRAMRERAKFLLEFAKIGRETGRRDMDPEPFFRWGEGVPWLLARPVLLWVARLMTLLPAGLMALDALEVIGGAYWILAVLLNLLVAGIAARRVKGIFDSVSFHKDRLGHYSVLMEALTDLECDEPAVAGLLDRLRVDGVSASWQMRRLERLSTLADLRFSPMLHLPVLAFTMWDFHVLAGLERWQRRIGGRCRDWFDALAEAEALLAMAQLAHDNPGWAIPGFEDGGSPGMRARALGHPLIPPKRRVDNDVEIGPAGTFLLVTGSNMSGKSTLLRAIGLNAALAGAGCAVCAREMTTSAFELRTSFRIRDSLEEGVSFFMAELRRLKGVVDRADALEDEGGGRLLFLLDEILQGTNVFERQIAVRTVLEHLVRAGAVGAISTHDLSLADAEGLAEKAVPVYFTESFTEDEGSMSPRGRRATAAARDPVRGSTGSVGGR